VFGVFCGISWFFSIATAGDAIEWTREQRVPKLNLSSGHIAPLLFPFWQEHKWPTPSLLHPRITYGLSAISAESNAIHNINTTLISGDIMAGTIYEDSSTDIDDSSTDVSGDEDVAGIILLAIK
jgi:hypothetical protein